MHTYIHTYIYYMHTCIHTYIYIYIYTHVTYVHMYIYVCVCIYFLDCPEVRERRYQLFVHLWRQAHLPGCFPVRKYAFDRPPAIQRPPTVLTSKNPSSRFYFHPTCLSWHLYRHISLKDERTDSPTASRFYDTTYYNIIYHSIIE